MTGTTTTASAAGVMAKDTPTYLRGRFQTKEVEEEEKVQVAAAKLREASKKANTQLPSDDEGSDASSDDSEDESGLSKKQRRLQAQQQYQHQLFLEQQEILQQQLAGVKGAGVGVLDGEGEEEKKPVAINHEAVIDRMKDRHRALLQGAHAAHTAVAREEYYEDYRDDFAMMQQHQGMMSPGGGPLAYNMQYGAMDPSVIYADDYRFQQQQQQQMYFPQGAHSHVNAATYNHPSMNGVIPGYSYAHSPGPMPSYSSGMQTPVYHHHHQNQYFQGGAPVMSHPIMHQQLQQLQQFQQGRSNSVDSDGSVPTSLSRRGSIHNSVVSSARASEDSWNDALQHQLQHSNSVLPTQKTANSDSGYSGVASDHGKHTSFDDSLEDIRTTVGSEYEKVSTNTTKNKIDDVTKMIDVFSISQASAAATDKDSDGDDEESQDSDSDSDSDSDDDDKSEDLDSDSEQDEDPESLKGSTMIDSIRYGGFKGTTIAGSSSSASAAASNIGSNEHDDENDLSDDDDQPIILSRHNSTRGVFLPTPAAASAGIKISAEEAAMMSSAQVMTPSQQQQMSVLTSNGQMQYLPLMTMYQQQPMHMSYMSPQSQQQPQQQVLSPQQQHAQLQQQQQYVPMGYQFSGSGPQPQGLIGHPHHQRQHSYSVDRAMPPPTMIVQGPAARRVTPIKGHTSTGSSSSAIQSQYPIPATTLLHPGPRRSQSARVRPQATSPINSSNNPAIAAAASAAAGQSGRGRSSLDFVRLPSSGYQSIIGGPMGTPSDFNSSGNGTGGYIRGYGEPLSPPQQPQQQQQPLPPHLLQHHQQIQQQMEKQQLQQQGYFVGGGGMSSMGGPQYGYMMQTGVGVGVSVGGDPYSSHPHQQQQILQAGRR